MEKTNHLQLETATDLLTFDAVTGQLVSLRSKDAPDQEFILAQPSDPVFIIQYLDPRHRFRQVSSRQVEAVNISLAPAKLPGQPATLTGTFQRLEGRDLHITITIQASPADRFSNWSLTLANGTDLLITDVQFPYVVLPYRLNGLPGSEALLWPFHGPGMLWKTPKPEDLQPDCPHTWQIRPENGDINHYPGLTFAQFLAYFDDRAGLYIACQDHEGRVKLIKPVHHEPGLRLGIAHIGDWPQRGQRKLEYPVVLSSFTGDWYAAAELYRAWSLQQPWATKPLHSRQDVPTWLKDSPPHIILRIQGELDIGPTQPKTEFLPYSKTIPLLEKLGERVEAPLVPVIMSWERPGPWVYPDCFPPAGGADTLHEFTELSRQHGWHIGTFCNGTRWVTGHFWSGYDGEDYFIAQGGDRSVCRTHTGELWHENWDLTWRPSYAGCMATPMTRAIALNFMQTVMGMGLDWIQFFDQNVGASTFPCFATDHGHPAVPGQWMTTAMRQLLADFHTEFERASARSAGESPGGGRTFVLSVEGPACEVFLPDFHICDVRVTPPGHGSPNQYFVPLYSYLYHEFILIQGGFGSAPEPYHLQIRNAYNLVVGEIPGAVMIGNGNLLNKDTFNWAPWEPEVGNNEDSVALLHAALALRNGPGRDFLTYGRMQRESQVEGIRVIRWQYGSREHQIPAVFHSAWQSPNGHFGCVLANWTTEAQKARVKDVRLGSQVIQHTSAAKLTSVTWEVSQDGLVVEIPPLGFALLEKTR